jgi:hypothetical protein
MCTVREIGWNVDEEEMMEILGAATSNRPG